MKATSIFMLPVLNLAFLFTDQPGMTTHSQAATTIQQSPVNSFSFFRTHRQGRGITANWGMSPVTGISGFLLEKTYEDPNDPYANWEIVCSQPGNALRSYRFTDNHVLPGYITYRVTAYLQLGSSIISPYSTEHIVAH